MRLALVLFVVACAPAQWPASGRLTSGFGIRFRGVIPSIHEGVDISVPEGTPVRAMRAGRVTHAGPLGAYGLTVLLDHGGAVTTLYAHLSRIDVAAGEITERGQVLGTSGRTGNATAPHLHFEVRRWGRAEDPIPLLGGPPPGEP